METALNLTPQHNSDESKKRNRRPHCRLYGTMAKETSLQTRYKRDTTKSTPTPNPSYFRVENDMSGAIIGGIVAVVLIVAFAFLKKGETSPATETEEATPSTSTEISTSNGKRNWLIGVSGEVAGKNYWVNSKTVTIGRAASNFIQITDSDASRIHCRIVPLASGVQAHDMDSSNGIFVNDKKVKRHLLQDQDSLQIGDCVFVYHQEGNFEETQLSNNKQVNTDVLRPTMQSSDGDIITQLIVKALQESGGDVAKVAEAVGVPESQIRAIAEENDITPST